jgi:hypothetical protein
MIAEQHSPLASAFLRVVIDLCAKARLHPSKRHFMAVLMESGERPRLMLRADLAARLRVAGLDEQAKAVDRKTKPHEILTFIISDECTGALIVPLARPRGSRGPLACALPTDAAIASLIGANMNEDPQPCPTCRAPETTQDHRQRCALANASIAEEVDRAMGAEDTPSDVVIHLGNNVIDERGVFVKREGGA